MEPETRTQKHKMEAKTATPPADKEYLEFEPSMEWAWEDKSGTVLLFLPDFSKQQLRVQVTSSGMLRLSGERPIGGQRWYRFFKEVPIPKNCDSNAINAKFENNILYVQLPMSTEQEVTTVNSNPQAEPQPQPQPPPPKQPQKKPPIQADPPMEPAEKPQKKAANEPSSGKPPPPQIPTNDQQPKGGEPKKEAQAPKQKPADEENSSTPTDQEENPKTNPTDGKASVKEGDELGAPRKEKRGGKDSDSTEKVTELEQGDNSVASGSSKSTLEGYTKVVGSMARDLRRGGKLFNLVVTVLLALLLGLYFGTMTKSSEKPNI